MELDAWKAAMRERFEEFLDEQGPGLHALRRPRSLSLAIWFDDVRGVPWDLTIESMTTAREKGAKLRAVR